jgi:ComF family protein
MVHEPVAERDSLRKRTRAWSLQVWRGFVDWLTPPKCLACKQDIAAGASLCLACWSKLVLIDEPVCDALGTPFAHDEGEGALSPAAVADPPPWDKARAAVAFDEASKALIHLLKYRDTHEAGLAMAQMMFGAGRKLIADCDLIVPVPLHRLRLWRRRFNQAAVLTQRLGLLSGKPFAYDALLRGVPTRTQVGLTAEERRKNVRRAFAVPLEKRPIIEGKTVLLVDDVRTTGATAGASVRALKDAGAARVHVLTFALVLEPTRLHIDA